MFASILEYRYRKAIHKILKINHFEYFPSIDSTNSRLMQAAKDGAENGTLYIAREQSCGRGRRGHSFVSPAGTGLYFSLLLRFDSNIIAPSPAYLTTAVAVAVANVLERKTAKKVTVKWVNDILLDHKKVCGILTEGAVDSQSGKLLYGVIGVGLNIYPPKEGFPPDIASIVTTLYDKPVRETAKIQLLCEIINELYRIISRFPQNDHLNHYRKYTELLGKTVTVINGTQIPYSAQVLDIAEDYRLHVVCSDGEERYLDSGEVSVRNE